ncbi:MOSC domain-containing protein [Snodgrassella sp. CFCC 13594]|uniref:MOSC domain-containing protein n=1 Tax=Snodgrassella sp. CFCC 13594 TaxID=1775559 RepID=UPI0008368DD7|nr:MOSC N-terminal beta barrel domain-containing protein [Snodgrassella sp. CFCC 13594]
MKVVALYYYPVKSMRGIPADSLTLHERGFDQDRAWLVAEPNGHFITARTHPQMVLWQAVPSDNALTLIAPNGEQHQVAVSDYTQPHEVNVWKDTFSAYQGLPETDAWLSTQLGRPCRLFYLGSKSHRILNHNGGELSFADGAPYLLTNIASLSALNQQLPNPVDMRRFRANIIVDAGVPYIEDGWQQAQIGSAILENFKPCSRCVLITVDPDTGVKDSTKEPLMTLAKTRKNQNGVCFGIHLTLVQPGVIHIGDEVIV